MKQIRWTLMALGLALVATTAVQASLPWCAWTAREANSACRNDAWDNFHETRSACQNNLELAERIACFRGANGAVQEDLAACADNLAERMEICETVGGDRYDPEFDPADFLPPDDIVMQNPYRSLKPGHTAVLRDGAGEELIVILVTDEVKEIEGVPCRVVVDVALEIEEADPDDGDRDPSAVEYVAVEVTDDWYAYHESGDIWYCGELARNFEDGELVDLDGSFKAGRDGAKPGVVIRFSPIFDETYRQEFAINEAEDLATVVSLAASPPGDEPTVACNGACLQTRDFTPLEPGVVESKFYLAGVGFVYALKYEDGVQEDGFEELACTGDSLDVLTDDPGCGIADPEQLVEKLCALAPEAFCPDAD